MEGRTDGDSQGKRQIFRSAQVLRLALGNTERDIDAKKKRTAHQMCKRKKEDARDLSLQGDFIAKEQWHKCSLAVHGSI
jgi:hypothetical protein